MMAPMASSTLVTVTRQLLGWVTLLTCASTFAAPKFEDSMAQRTLACTACHGEQGRAGPDGYHPRLAGKPAAYLYHQLLNFRDGRRHNGLMTRLVHPLSDAYLMEIAQHFAGMDLPYPPPAPQARVAADVLQRGRALALQGDPQRGLPACTQCHGAALTGALPAVPGLLGLPLDYLNAQLGAWRTKQRRAHAPDCMAQVVDRLRPDDVAAVTHWLVTQPLPANTRPAPAPAPAPPSWPAGTQPWQCGSDAAVPGAGR